MKTYQRVHVTLGVFGGSCYTTGNVGESIGEVRVCPLFKKQLAFIQN
jgi:hypothetical protein